MKIGSFPMVQRIMEARNGLVRQRDDARLEVSLNSANQDQEMVEACRPVVVRILNQRIAELDRDLEQLGVDVDS